MEQKDVFALALGLAGTPWKVVEIRFDGDLKRLNIEVDFPPGSRFPHPGSGEACAVYDSEPRSWRHRHLNSLPVDVIGVYVLLPSSF